MSRFEDERVRAAISGLQGRAAARGAARREDFARADARAENK